MKEKEKWWTETKEKGTYLSYLSLTTLYYDM